LMVLETLVGLGDQFFVVQVALLLALCDSIENIDGVYPHQEDDNGHDKPEESVHEFGE